MFTKSTVSQSMIDAVNSILEEEKKIQQLDEASAFDWKANKNETDPKFTTKKPGERTGHESKKTATGTVYTKKPLRSDGQEFKKEETEISFKDRLLALKNAQRHIQTESKTFDELLEDLNDAQVDKIIYEVLGKDADAGDYIHDFIHSKNPKFAGKSKEMRKKMALGAYYGKHNEEVEQIDELSKGTLDSYMDKAKDRYIKHASSTSTFSPSANQKSVKYAKNILKAKEKGGKFSEEVELDEANKANKESKKDFDARQARLAAASKASVEDPLRLKRLSSIPGYTAAMDLAKKTTKEELIGGQKKIDKNHNGKIDAQDFQILRGQKKSQKNEGVMDVVKKAGTKALHVLGHGSDEDMKKDLQKKMGISQKDVSTDTLAGRVQGGAPNQHSSHKIALKAEAVDKDKPPFDGPYTKAKGNIKDKSGAIHTPMSRARDLAKTAMKKVKTEMLGKTGTSE